MKTVTGEIISSNPVSVSKAASILSKFVSAETGASQAVNAYLRRATAAFDELVRLHSKSDCRRHKGDQSTVTTARITDASELTPSKSCEVETKADKKKKKEKRKNEGDYGNEAKMEDIHEADKIVAETQKIKEQKPKDKEVNGSFVYYGDDDLKLKEESERKEKEKKKKREKCNVGYSEENDGEVGEEAEIEEDKGERRKKRKNRDVEEIGDGSQSKKKKKR
ncbi:hypothetical protein K2173_027109 [Erythroxylum novogranatense]|uniref:Uncharacterized protein n=1 Tax=Erythroxylum novogranatense TaxID=1862640 RepID=A0AAV8TYF3_9ROSI|nr:hypothetical protein K2173_027109 [Erythroxylum novogranatense]